MSRIHDSVARYFSNRDWPSEDHADYFATPVAGHHGQWTAIFDLREDDEQLLVYSVIAVNIPEERRNSVALYLTRANNGLAIGNFEMDLDNGDVRFKTSIDVEEAELSDALIDHLFLANVVSADRYLPGIHAVAAGEDPVSAADSAESS